jgi:DNA polymerase III delta prime subunit
MNLVKNISLLLFFSLTIPLVQAEKYREAKEELVFANALEGLPSSALVDAATECLKDEIKALSEKEKPQISKEILNIIDERTKEANQSFFFSRIFRHTKDILTIILTMSLVREFFFQASQNKSSQVKNTLKENVIEEKNEYYETFRHIIAHAFDRQSMEQKIEDFCKKKATHLNLCFHGIPGLGKTALIKEIAKKIFGTIKKNASPLFQEVILIEKKIGDFASSFVQGDIVLFGQFTEEVLTVAKKNPRKAYIIVFDDADILFTENALYENNNNASAKKSYTMLGKQHLQAFLDKIDSEKIQNIACMAATNYITEIPDSLKRGGHRFSSIGTSFLTDPHVIARFYIEELKKCDRKSKKKLSQKINQEKLIEAITSDLNEQKQFYKSGNLETTNKSPSNLFFTVNSLFFDINKFITLFLRTRDQDCRKNIYKSISHRFPLRKYTLSYILSCFLEEERETNDK